MAHPQLCRRATAPPLSVQRGGSAAPPPRRDNLLRAAATPCAALPPRSLAHSLNHKCRARPARPSPPAEFGGSHSLALPLSLRPRTRWWPHVASGTRAGTHRRRARLGSCCCWPHWPARRVHCAADPLPDCQQDLSKAFLILSRFSLNLSICFRHFLKNLGKAWTEELPRCHVFQTSSSSFNIAICGILVGLRLASTSITYFLRLQVP